MQTKFNIGDHVKILDGNKIENYFGGWAPTMDFTIGKIVTIDKIRIGKNGIGYLTEEIPFTFDERGLELAHDAESTKSDDNLLFLAAILAGLV